MQSICLYTRLHSSWVTTIRNEAGDNLLLDFRLLHIREALNSVVDTVVECEEKLEDASFPILVSWTRCPLDTEDVLNPLYPDPTPTFERRRVKFSLQLSLSAVLLLKSSSNLNTYTTIFTSTSIPLCSTQPSLASDDTMPHRLLKAGMEEAVTSTSAS